MAMGRRKGRMGASRAAASVRRSRAAARTVRSRRAAARRYLIGMTGASGSAYGVDFIRRCPGEKFLVLSDWARQVLHSETGIKPSTLEPFVQRIFADTDLAAPFASDRKSVV